MKATTVNYDKNWVVISPTCSAKSMSFNSFKDYKEPLALDTLPTCSSFKKKLEPKSVYYTIAGSHTVNAYGPAKIKFFAISIPV